MAKTSVYLPDELAEQARAYGVPVSEVAQAAVRQAVRAAQIEESVMTEISAGAERLQAPGGPAAGRGRNRAGGSRGSRRGVGGGLRPAAWMSSRPSSSPLRGALGMTADQDGRERRAGAAALWGHALGGPPRAEEWIRAEGTRCPP